MAGLFSQRGLSTQVVLFIHYVVPNDLGVFKWFGNIAETNDKR